MRASYGYFEEFDVPALVTLVAEAGVESPLEAEDASYFLSKIELEAGVAADADGDAVATWSRSDGVDTRVQAAAGP